MNEREKSVIATILLQELENGPKTVEELEQTLLDRSGSAPGELIAKIGVELEELGELGEVKHWESNRWALYGYHGETPKSLTEVRCLHCGSSNIDIKYPVWSHWKDGKYQKTNTDSTLNPTDSPLEVSICCLDCEDLSETTIAN